MSHIKTWQIGHTIIGLSLSKLISFLILDLPLKVIAASNELTTDCAAQTMKSLIWSCHQNQNRNVFVSTVVLLVSSNLALQASWSTGLDELLLIVQSSRLSVASMPNILVNFEVKVLHDQLDFIVPSQPLDLRGTFFLSAQPYQLTSHICNRNQKKEIDYDMLYKSAASHLILIIRTYHLQKFVKIACSDTKSP